MKQNKAKTNTILNKLSQFVNLQGGFPKCQSISGDKHILWPVIQLKLEN